MKNGTGAKRLTRWEWLVSGMLLLATMLNYMDRQTLANLSVRITSELALSQEKYGDLELAFGWAFACGSLAFGILADRLPVRWLYPAVVVGWSAVGFLTGFANSFGTMIVCRTLLGFFEAGHWPCALKTTQAVLSRENRMFGNSILQSGGAIGAIITPIVIRLMVGNDMTAGAWRPPFIVIGGIGVFWVMGWLSVMRSTDLEKNEGNSGNDDALLKDESKSKAGAVWWEACLTNRRFWAVLPMVVCINITWHLLRVWLPKFLQQGRGASEAESLMFNSLFYVAADIGCISAGAAGLWLARRGLSVHRSREVVVAVCAVLTALTSVAAMLPRGYGLYAVLLVIGAGSMGLFPCYYSLAQEVSPKHMGKATGLLATVSWLVSGPMQKYFGRVVDRTGSFDTGIALAGWAPALALIALVLVWPKEKPEQPEEAI